MAPSWHAREPGEGGPRFPPRCGMTFGEVVSSYNMFGSSAAKRHDYMIHRQETQLPDERCTIHEKVARKPDHDRDPFKSWVSSSREALTPGRWPTTRSRTPSPWMPRRPRSAPGTPRASTPLGLRPSDSRYLKDHPDYANDNYLGEYRGAGGLYDSRPDARSGERVRYAGSALDTFSVDHVAADTFAVGAETARSRGLPPNVPTFALSAGNSAGTLGDSPPRQEPLSYLGGGSGAAASARHPAPLPESGVPPLSARHPAPLPESGVPPLRSPPQQARLGGSGGGRLGAHGGGAEDRWKGEPRGYTSDFTGRGPSQANARAASFVRLNSFLLRTHVTSLVSALAEDGWLETWEKERLCSQAREDSPVAWLQAFFRSYMRFMETEDVPAFVAGLRSQIL